MPMGWARWATLCRDHFPGRGLWWRGTSMAIKLISQKITAETSIKEVVTKYPQTIKVFFNHGMQCTGCYI